MQTTIKSQLATHPWKQGRALHYQSLLGSPCSDMAAHNANIYSRKSSGMISHQKWQQLIKQWFLLWETQLRQRFHINTTQRRSLPIISCNLQSFPSDAKCIWREPSWSMRQKRWHESSRDLINCDYLRLIQLVSISNFTKTFVLRLKHPFCTYCLLIVMSSIYLFRW